MYPYPLLHVVTERVDSEPRGVTFESDVYTFREVLHRVATHEFDTRDPARGMRDVMYHAFRRGTSPVDSDFSGAHSLEPTTGSALVLDYPHGEVTLYMDGCRMLRSAFTADGVRPLLQAVWDPDPFLYYDERAPFPKRAAVRVITKREGPYSSGFDAQYPSGGDGAVAGLLGKICSRPLDTVGDLLANVWYQDGGLPVYAPFQGKLLGDEYEPAAPVSFQSDCPVITVDLAERSLRLSDERGALVMVVDLEAPAVERVRAEFIARTGWQEPRAPLAGPGLHPDYVQVSEVAPF